MAGLLGFVRVSSVLLRKAQTQRFHRVSCRGVCQSLGLPPPKPSNENGKNSGEKRVYRAGAADAASVSRAAATGQGTSLSLAPPRGLSAWHARKLQGESAFSTTELCITRLPELRRRNMSTTAETSTVDGDSDDVSTNGTHKDVTQLHYTSHSSQSYESSFFTEQGAYMEYLCRTIYEALGWDIGGEMDDTATAAELAENAQPAVPTRLIDIGGGTGNFTWQLLAMAANKSKQRAPKAHATDASIQTLGGTRRSALVVDPFLSKSDVAQNTSNGAIDLGFVSAPAEAFMTDSVTCNANDPLKDPSTTWRFQPMHQILLKEVVHHLNVEDRVGIFRGMYDNLQPCQSIAQQNGTGKDECRADQSQRLPPSILIVTRPHVDIDYPLWDEARAVWADNQPSTDDLALDLQRAGFKDVSVVMHVYPCAVQLQRWQEMVRNRSWSTFSHFTDEELDAACATIAEDYAARIGDDGLLSFEDRLIFLSGHKY